MGSYSARSPPYLAWVGLAAAPRAILSRPPKHHASIALRPPTSAPVTAESTCNRSSGIVPSHFRIAAASPDGAAAVPLAAATPRAALALAVPAARSRSLIATRIRYLQTPRAATSCFPKASDQVLLSCFPLLLLVRPPVSILRRH